jgi:hypothetical protein
VFVAAGHAAARHRPAGASAAEQARHVMAHAVATSLAGSVVLLALAVLVVVVVMRRPPAAAAAAAETARAR